MKSWRTTALSILATGLSIAATSSASASGCIRLGGHTVDTAVACPMRGEMSRQVRHLKLVQYAGVPTAADRAALTNAGIRIIALVPDNTLLVAMSGNSATAAAADTPITFVGDYLPRFAIGQKLAGHLSSLAPVTINVVLAGNESDIASDLEWLDTNAVNVELSTSLGNSQGVSARIEGIMLEELAARPSVIRVELGDAFPLPQDERSSLVTAGQTYYDGNIEKAVSALHTEPGKNRDYLKFLKQRLKNTDARQADYTDSREYPIVSYIDDGLDPFSAYIGTTPGNEDRLYADNPDLHEFGDITRESRIEYAFRYDYAAGSNVPVVIDGVPAQPDPAYPFGYLEITEQNIQMSAVSHTAGTTSVLAGFNDGMTNADRDGDDPTQFGTLHRYGIGVSPYGRIAGCAYDLAPTVLAQYFPSPPAAPVAADPSLFQPEDFALIAAEIHRRTALEDGFVPNTALTNDSFLLYYLGATPDCTGLDEQPLRPPINGKEYHSFRATNINEYDLYAQRFDALTRESNYWQDSDTLKSGETLFVCAAGNFGFYVSGASPSQHCPTPNPLPPVIPTDLEESVPRMGEIAAPAIGKNTLAIGGTEVWNPKGTIEYCDSAKTDFSYFYQTYVGFRSNTNSQDIMANSSKGWEAFTRTNDVRIKPDLVAPASGEIFNAVRDPRDFAGGIRPAGCEDVTNMIRAYSSDLGGYRTEFNQCLDCILPAFRADLWIIPSVKMFYDVVVDGETVRIYQDDDNRAYITTDISGTSSSAPHATGAIQLFGYFMRNQYGIENPSAALYKAYAIHTARMLEGRHTGPYHLIDPATYTFDVDDYVTLRIPNPYQGFGRIDTDMGLDKTPRYFVNQEYVLEEGGPRLFTISGKPKDPKKPVRVALVWTDPPAAAGTDAWHDALVNDLDLIVQTYDPNLPFLQRLKFFVGNLFQDPEPDVRGGSICHSKKLGLFNFDNGEFSLGFADQVDTKNNVECVFLAPKVYNDESSITKQTSLRVSVLARTLAGDALSPYDPQNGTNRQDFALVAYNFIPDSPAVLIP